MSQRPLDFRIDYQSPLAKGLVFAGLGRHPKSIRYTDSSLFKSVATQGKVINVKGGVPIVVDGHTIGGIGVGSGTGDQDLEVAKAGLAAIPGAKTAF